MSTLLSINLIRTDGGTQPRGAVNPNVIDTYQDAMDDGAVFPPVDVFYDGTDYWLADGFHRLRAKEATRTEQIESTIHQGTVGDAQWFSFGANKANGLYRSNDDKQRAVKAALVHPRSVTLSDNAIAQHCGVSQPFVSKLRGDASYNGSKMETRTVTRNGTTYQQNTANIGATAKQADAEAVPERVLTESQKEILAMVSRLLLREVGGKRKTWNCGSKKDFKQLLLEMVKSYERCNGVLNGIVITHRDDGAPVDVDLINIDELYPHLAAGVSDALPDEVLGNPPLDGSGSV